MERLSPTLSLHNGPCESPQAISVQPPLATPITTLSKLVQAHQEEVSNILLSSKRTRLAKLIAKLPESAKTAYALCLTDLPTAADALGLSSLALACNFAINGELVEAVQAADRAVIMLGPSKEVLAFVDAVEQCMESMAAGMSGKLERWVKQDMFNSQTVLGNRDEVRMSVPKHLSGVCAEVAAPDFDLESFSEYFKRDEPVLIHSCAPWHALKAWRNVSYWRRYSHRMVPVELENKDGKMEEAFLPLGDVIGAMLSGKRVYMAQHALLSRIPSLQKDIEVPQYTKIGGGADLINVWMGSSGTGSKLHHDSADNILVQVVGHKTVILIPPTDPVYANPGSNFSPIDVEIPDYKCFPRFAGATGKVVELAPGDGLYIPAGYWHYVKSRTSSISVNFWF